MAPKPTTIKCIVPLCCNSKRTNLELRFYQFPQDQARRSAWLESLSMTEEMLKKKSHICENHFRKEFIGVHRLTKNAVPFRNNIQQNDPPSDHMNDIQISLDGVQTDIQFIEDKPNFESCQNVEHISDNSSFENKIDFPSIAKEILISEPVKNISDPLEATSLLGTTSIENLLNESSIKIEPTNEPFSTEVVGDTVLDSNTALIADNLECSSTDSFACGNDQNIFATNFTHKNPIFLDARITKYENDLKKIIENKVAFEEKLNAMLNTNKAARNRIKDRDLKEMELFHEIYDRPQMKIPKLIFERFMLDYDETECPEDLKQFACDVHSHSSEAYDYLQKQFDVLPAANDLTELIKKKISERWNEEE